MLIIPVCVCCWNSEGNVISWAMLIIPVRVCCWKKRRLLGPYSLPPKKHCLQGPRVRCNRSSNRLCISAKLKKQHRLLVPGSVVIKRCCRNHRRRGHDLWASAERKFKQYRLPDPNDCIDCAPLLKYTYIIICWALATHFGYKKQYIVCQSLALYRLCTQLWCWTIQLDVAFWDPLINFSRYVPLLLC